MPTSRIALLALLWWSACPALAASLEELRAAALEAANADRAAHDLPPLEYAPALNEAAQAHAEDMRGRGYVGHVSPEGRTAMDRYRAAGGERWRKVGENVAHCAGCGAPDPGSVRRFERGWMNSPEHRRNILDPGFRRFGFGLAAADGEQYAVQTFAGPGAAEGAAAPPQELAAKAIEVVNARRVAAGAPALLPSERLSEAAQAFLARSLPESGLEGAADALLGELGPQWRALVVLSGQCGGCGTGPTVGDAERFVHGWLERPGYRRRLLDADFSRFGFAVWADGEGRKAALALLAGS